MAKKLRMLAIDPSMQALGWALFEGTRIPKYGLLKGTKVLSARRGGPSKKLRKSLAFWVKKTDKMVLQVKRVMGRMTDVIDVVVIEMPRIYVRGSAKSKAAKNSGAIEKLLFLVASLRSTLRIIYGCEVVLVYPQTWKGQTSKDVTLRRMIRRYGHKVKHLNHNVVDAIGIGTWYVEKHT